MPRVPPASELFTIPDHQDLFLALQEWCGRREGWVQGAGRVENVELRVPGEGSDLRKILRGRWALATLNGPMGGPYTVVLSRAVQNGSEVWAGELLSARSVSVQGVGFMARLANADIEPESVNPVQPAVGIESQVTAAAVGTLSPAAGWAAQAHAVAAAQSVAGGSDEDEDEGVSPERGDLVHHFAFGFCEVLLVNGGRLTLRDVQGPGRIREVVSDMLIVSRPGQRDGKRFFKLTRKP